MNTLHIIAGLPASGKTTYGRALAARLNAAFLDIDTATEPVVKAGLALAKQNPNDRDSPIFKKAFRIPIYYTLFQVALENLPHINVVLVGPFTAELRNPNWLDSLIQRIQAPIEIHYVTCNPEQRRLRMQHRNQARDKAKLSDWERHLAYYRNETPPAFEHRFVDTSNDFTSH